MCSVLEKVTASTNESTQNTHCPHVVGFYINKNVSMFNAEANNKAYINQRLTAECFSNTFQIQRLVYQPTSLFGRSQSFLSNMFWQAA